MSQKLALKDPGYFRVPTQSYTVLLGESPCRALPGWSAENRRTLNMDNENYKDTHFSSLQSTARLSNIMRIFGTLNMKSNSITEPAK